MNPTQTRKEMCLNGLRTRLLVGFAISLFATASYGQVPSTDGTFTATGPTNPNLTLQTVTGSTISQRLTILNSSGNVGINTTSPADRLHVNGNVRATQFNVTGGTFILLVQPQT